MYKVRAILDTQEDVIRTFVIDENKSLEDMHFAAAKAFGFDGQEMASFYRTDDEWNQGEEIPLFNMAEAGEGLSMANCSIKETLLLVNDKLIYVYDFLHMWTFYIELVALQADGDDGAVVLSVGEIPGEAPMKEFKADDLTKGDDKEFDDEFGDNFTGFERLDDFDFDNY